MKVIFTSSNLPLALAIRFMTGCKWHHCGVIYNDDLVIEASAIKGVRGVPLDDFKSRGDFVIINVPTNDEQASQEFLFRQLTKGYDWAGALGYPFRLDWQNKDKWYCSELVAIAAKRGKSPIVRNDVRSVTPRDIWMQRFEIIETNDRKLNLG